jgi:hypothetical protein
VISLTKSLINYFQTQEEYTELKLDLIKIAALLNEDEEYHKKDALKDVLAVIEKIEEFDIQVKDRAELQQGPYSNE